MPRRKSSVTRNKNTTCKKMSEITQTNQGDERNVTGAVIVDLLHAFIWD